MIIYPTNLYPKEPTLLTMAAGEDGFSTHMLTLQTVPPAKPNPDDFAQGCATGKIWQSLPAKSTGQGGLGWTTGLTQKTPGDPYLQRSPMPPPEVSGWGASRQLPCSSLRAAVGRGAIAASHRTDRCWQSRQVGPRDYSSQQPPRVPALSPSTAPPPRPLGAVVPPPPPASPTDMLLLAKEALCGRKHSETCNMFLFLKVYICMSALKNKF